MEEKSESMTQDTGQFAQLCDNIEKALHRKMRTPKDFETLHDMVFERTHVMMSTTTLKRIWGYIASDYKPSGKSLDTLAQFLGYADYDSFCKRCISDDGSQPSDPVVSRHINVEDDLKTDDAVTLYWAPDRVCHVRYLGHSRFMVNASENTRLKEGDTFSCSLIIEGEPLYISQLVQGSCPPTNYVCGKQSGVRFQLG